MAALGVAGAGHPNEAMSLRN